MKTDIPYERSWPIRLYARVRAHYPLVPVLMGLMCGQTAALFVLSASMWGGFSAVLSAFGIILLITVRKSRSGDALLRPFALGMALGVTSVQLPLVHEREAGLLTQTIPRVMLRVTSFPSRPEPGLVQFEAEVLAHTNADELSYSWQSQLLRCRAVDLPWRIISGVSRGDVLMAEAHVKPLTRSTNPFSYSASLSRHGISAECKIRYAALISRASPGFFERLRTAMHETVVKHVGNNEAAGLILALVIGERNGLSTRTERYFRDTGLSHVLVLSGYQVSLIYLLTFAVVSWMTRQLYGVGGGLRYFTRIPTHMVPRLLSLLVAISFVLVARIEPSSLRAALALGIIVMARFSERSNDLWHSIIGSLFLMCLVWPGIFFEAGTQLTYAALIGIAVGKAPRLTYSPPWLTYVRVSFWATLLPSLVALLWFDRFSPLGLILSPAIAPLIACFGTVGGGITLALAMLHLDRHGVLLRSIATGLEYVRDAVRWLAQLPFASCEPGSALSILLTIGVLSLLLNAFYSRLKQRIRAWNCITYRFS